MTRLFPQNTRKIAEQRIATTYARGGRPACRVTVLLRVMILQRLAETIATSV